MRVVQIARWLSISLTVASAAQASDPVCFSKHLFKVQGSAPTSYLLGTGHYVDSKAIMTPELMAALKHSGTYVFEADASQVTPQTLKMPEGQSLDQLLSPESWAKLKRYFSMIPEAHLKSLLPQAIDGALANWVVSQHSQDPGMSHPHQSAGLGMDAEFMQAAAVAQKKVVYLERLEDTMKVMKSPAEIQRNAAILNQILSQDDISKLYLQLYKKKFPVIDAYVTGDPSRILRLTSDELARSPEAAAQVESQFYARNHKWMKELPGLLRGPGTFAAVGVGHLYGDQGLIRLLEAQGVRLERVATACPVGATRVSDSAFETNLEAAAGSAR